jgi:hypothetical protein
LTVENAVITSNAGGILALMWRCLPETLPLPPPSPRAGSSATAASGRRRASTCRCDAALWRALSPLHHYGAGWQLVRQDWLLVAMCVWVRTTCPLQSGISHSPF